MARARGSRARRPWVAEALRIGGSVDLSPVERCCWLLCCAFGCQQSNRRVRLRTCPHDVDRSAQHESKGRHTIGCVVVWQHRPSEKGDHPRRVSLGAAAPHPLLPKLRGPSLQPWPVRPGIEGARVSTQRSVSCSRIIYIMENKLAAVALSPGVSHGTGVWPISGLANWWDLVSRRRSASPVVQAELGSAKTTCAALATGAPYPFS